MAAAAACSELSYVLVNVYNHHPPNSSRQTQKLRTLTVDTHLCMATLIFYAIHLTTHFNHSIMHTAWVDVQCEASKATCKYYMQLLLQGYQQTTPHCCCTMCMVNMCRMLLYIQMASFTHLTNTLTKQLLLAPT